MALFNEIQAGRFSALLQKLCSIKGAAPSPQLAGEIIPTLPLEVDRPEWKYLANERLAIGTKTEAAVAGENSTVQLMNISNRGVIIVIEEIQYFVNGALQVFGGHWDTLASGAGASAGAYGFRDGRLPRGVAASAGVVMGYHQVGTPITSVMYRGRLPNEVRMDKITQPIVLSPGSGFALTCQTVNQPIDVTFYWRERKIEPDEELA